MVIAIDFDGTMVKHKFPDIGENIGAEVVIKELIDKGHDIILYTMRSDNVIDGKYYLTEAVDWCKYRGIKLYGINNNPTQSNWTLSPKVYAELYIDDCALGVPLRYDLDSNKGYVDWVKVKEILKLKKIL